VCLLACLALVAAQDPANGWMAYAVGALPAKYTRITRLEMTWKVSANAKRSRAFYSPWFGMDPADNLNLIQPVNPWSGDAWSMYTEYFQWSPEHNSNSNQQSVKAGQTLHGALTYMEASDSYTLTQKVVETGATSTQVVKCQSGKKYTVPYVVYEKAFPCGDYPPDEVVSFNIVAAECDGKDCTADIAWTAQNEDNKHCDMMAHIGADNKQINITWNTAATSELDGLSDAQLYDLNYNGWATALNITRPAEPEITCEAAKGGGGIPCAAGNDACCDGPAGQGQSCYTQALQSCCTTGPGKGHVCAKGKCSTRPGFICN
jgi:hypothetical protein